MARKRGVSEATIAKAKKKFAMIILAILATMAAACARS
jgi:hypothetical protein